MLETVFRSEDVPAGERFERWRELARAHVPGAEMTSASGADFRAALRVARLGAVRLTVATCPDLHTRRPPGPARRSDEDVYRVGFLTAGSARVAHAGREVAMRPGQLVLSAGRYAHRGWLGPGRNTLALVGIPPGALPLPGAEAERLLTRAVPAEHGMGALVAGFLDRLIRDGGQYSASDAARLGTILTDLLGAMLAHEAEAVSALPPETHRGALLIRVRAFIEQHLGDPRLSPRMVADAHHISSRYLHRLFQGQDTTVAAWIRVRRLERCRRDLADPALASTPIGALAARWGFVHPADFSRAFRARYGVSPREYRQAALEGTREAGRC